jgi:pyrroline-5-carboxylate reductase
MEAMADAATELGLTKDIAEKFSAQTALGAAQLVAENNLSFSELRAKVTTPNGTTASALKVLEEGDIRGLMKKALTAAYQRSMELAKEGI